MKSLSVRRCRLLGVLIILLMGGSCSEDGQGAQDHWVDPIFIDAIGPAPLVPGTRLVIEGEGFLDDKFGRNRVHFVGPTGSEVDVLVDGTFVSPQKLTLDVTRELIQQLAPSVSRYQGAVRVETGYLQSESFRASNVLEVDWEIRDALTPRADVQSATDVYINDRIVVSGAELLAGSAEGSTVARIGGCFYPGGEGSCIAIDDQELPVVLREPTKRDNGYFVLPHTLLGIRPGVFRGSVQILNINGGDRSRIEAAPEQPVEYVVQPSRISAVQIEAASLGQFINIDGAGFVGGSPDALTQLEFQGTFTNDASGVQRPVDTTVVAEYVWGRRVRYILDEVDGLGEAINLRRESGWLEGSIVPVLRAGPSEERGTPVPFRFRIASVKQVVVVVFLPSYSESLGRYGLRAVDERVRKRALAMSQAPYRGINVEFRTALPEDYALYSVVEISGKDPNDQGLFGYDNTAGKDTNNRRLNDRIGGVNAATQEQGYPGYGGVFIESFFEFAEGGEIADPFFDFIFDPIRPDRGEPVTQADLTAGIPELADGRSCVETKLERPMQIACAIWVMGNLIGSTLSHEVGHSLGLANPYEPMSFHNSGDKPRRLMDSGGARPFYERADLDGKGGAQFCDMEYEYLREIMPDGDPDSRSRPGCY